LHFFIPRESTRLRTTIDCKGFADKVLKSAKKVKQDKKVEDPKGDFPEVHKEVNYIYGGPNS
jgi:hypothetical protein